MLNLTLLAEGSFYLFSYWTISTAFPLHVVIGDRHTKEKKTNVKGEEVNECNSAI